MIEYSLEKIQKLLTYKIVRYGLVGGISTFIHFSVASLYIYSISNSVFQANVVGFLVAYIFSYLMQSRLVFEHEINIKKAIKYFIVQFGVLLLAILASTLFESFNSYIRTLIITVLIPLITFMIHKFWTFKEKVK